MRVRGRLVIGRTSFLASLVAVLVLVAGPGAALANVGGGPAPAAERPAPREQLPGDPTGFRLPFAPGLEVPIHQGWGSPFSHNGRAAYAYDFGLHEGTPILAAASGVVSFTHAGEGACGGADLRNNANYITIDHPDGSATQYGHLATVDVEVGDVVTVGEAIGTSGKTGFTGCQPHLHFARQLQGSPVTQSIPVYFDGYPDAPLHNGQLISAVTSGCPAAEPDAPTDGFCGTYAALDAEEVPGSVFFSRVETAIDFDWAAAAPGGYWLDDASSGFAARWSGQFVFLAGGTYSFRAAATDRLRVSVDGFVVLDGWEGSPSPRALGTTWNLGPGIHRVEVEYEDLDGEGILRLAWSKLAVDDDGRWATSGPLPK